MSENKELLTFRAAVGLPLLQALFTGILLGFVCWGILRYLSVENSTQISILIGSVISAMAWLISLAVWRRLIGFSDPEPTEVKESVLKVHTYNQDERQIKISA